MSLGEGHSHLVTNIDPVIAKVRQLFFQQWRNSNKVVDSPWCEKQDDKSRHNHCLADTGALKRKKKTKKTTDKQQNHLKSPAPE